MSEFPVRTVYEVVGAENVIRENRRLWRSYQQGEIQVKAFSDALRENMRGTYAMRRAYSGIRMAVRVNMAGILETTRAMMALGHIGTKILQMWQAYTIAQYRVERAQRDVVAAARESAKWQNIHNQYLEDFGKESVLTRDAAENLADAMDDYKDAQERAAKAQQDMIAGYIGMAFQTIGIGANIVDLIYHLTVLRGLVSSGQMVTGISALTNAFTGLGTATGLAGAGLGAVGTGIAAIAGTFALSGGLIAATKTPEQLEREQEARRSWHEREISAARGTRAGAPAGIFQEFQRLTDEFMHSVNTFFGDLLRPLLGGGGQFGINEVPRTGLYLLHQGEQVRRPFDRGQSPRVANIYMYNTFNTKTDIEDFYYKVADIINEKMGGMGS